MKVMLQGREQGSVGENSRDHFIDSVGKSPNDNFVSVELRFDALARMISSSHLCAEDLRGLDNTTKRKIWRICLHAAACTESVPIS